MKSKLFISLLLAVVMFVVLATPVLAAPPEKGFFEKSKTEPSGWGKYSFQATHDNYLKVTDNIRGAEPDKSYQLVLWFVEELTLWPDITNQTAARGLVLAEAAMTDIRGNLRYSEVLSEEYGFDPSEYKYYQLQMLDDNGMAFTGGIEGVKWGGCSVIEKGFFKKCATEPSGWGKYSFQASHDNNLKVTVVIKGAETDKSYQLVLWFIEELTLWPDITNQTTARGLVLTEEAVTDNKGNLRYSEVLSEEYGFDPSEYEYYQLQVLDDSGTAFTGGIEGIKWREYTVTDENGKIKAYDKSSGTAKAPGLGITGHPHSLEVFKNPVKAEGKTGKTGG